MSGHITISVSPSSGLGCKLLATAQHHAYLSAIIFTTMIVMYLPVGGTRSMCSQINSEETRNAKHAGLYIQKERYMTCFLPRGLGAAW